LHAKDCIERACDQCGVHLIKFSQYEWYEKQTDITLWPQLHSVK
jgi:hypothetical protein